MQTHTCLCKQNEEIRSIVQCLHSPSSKLSLWYSDLVGTLFIEIIPTENLQFIISFAHSHLNLPLFFYLKYEAVQLNVNKQYFQELAGGGHTHHISFNYSKYNNNSIT